VCGDRPTEVTADYGYPDGSGVHQVVKRLQRKAKTDRAVAGCLKALTDTASSVKSCPPAAPVSPGMF